MGGQLHVLDRGGAGGVVLEGLYLVAAGLVQGVEGVEKLFLGVFLALDELDVVDEDQIGDAVAVAEGLHAVLADGLDQVVGEGFGGNITHH